MKNEARQIIIVGAGLIGTLLALYVRRRGYRVAVYERRSDPRDQTVEEGRSINLALSRRGIRALEEVGVMESVKPMAIPMHGRMMHDPAGKLTFQPYGREGQYINSISRKQLNETLLDRAEKNGVEFFFSHRCLHIDLTDTRIFLQKNGSLGMDRPADIIIGADGAFSSVRSAFQITDRFNYDQFYIAHGYKELSIEPDMGHHLDQNALHIWPRESFMMIALPNPDRSFTCTLFCPFEGKNSFEWLNDTTRRSEFFKRNFSDATPLLGDLDSSFEINSPASLVTIRCFPWVRNRTMLIGDAAHAIVPFFGQGMNAGFEDCRILNGLLDEYADDWTRAMDLFQQNRKPDADAIAELALDNFVEMRDYVADEHFLLRKKIEAKLHELFPDKWIPLYSMVTFDDNISYSDAHHVGRRQKIIMDEVMKTPGISHRWQDLNFNDIVSRLH